MNRMKRAGLTVVLLCAGLFCCGCLSGNAVRALEATPEEARSYYDASGAAVQGLPFDSRNYLQTHLLMETFQDSPELLISRLKKEQDEEQSPFLLNVLADVCYSLAQQEESDASGPYFLSAAFCYYRLLFDPSVRRVSRSRFDPAALRAVMRYNVASGMVFQYLQRHNLLDRSSFSLPLADGGQIFFAEPARLDGPLPRERIRAFYLCANYRTENLQHFSCEFGIGVPLFAKALPLKSGADGLKFPDGIALPMTGLLRFTRRGNAIRARFELYDALKTGSAACCAPRKRAPASRPGFGRRTLCHRTVRSGQDPACVRSRPDVQSANLDSAGEYADERSGNPQPLSVLVLCVFQRQSGSCLGGRAAACARPDGAGIWGKCKFQENGGGRPQHGRTPFENAHHGQRQHPPRPDSGSSVERGKTGAGRGKECVANAQMYR